MSDSTKDLKPLELKLRRLLTVIIEQAERDAEFAARLAKVLNAPDGTHVAQAEKRKTTAFNPVDILHREGPEALQRQLELRTDTELKNILRQQGLWKRKGEKQPLNRIEATRSIIASAERRLHQGSSFLQSGPPQES